MGYRSDLYETLSAYVALYAIIFQVNSDLKLRDTYCKVDRLAVTSGGNVLMVTDS